MTKLLLNNWLKRPQIISIMTALMSSGSDVRFVGGCVRDSLLKKPISDIDIGTPDTPQQVAKILNKKGIKFFSTGIKHGTLTAVVDDHLFQITSLRKDVKTDGRHAIVEYTRNWIEDAKRRDFTINTFSASFNRNLFDPLNSMSDLLNKKVKFVGCPKARIKEDYLRILRFYRFNGLFSGEITDSVATKACTSEAHFLLRLSKERIRDELIKILLVHDPSLVFKRMEKDGILKIILPEGQNIVLLNSLCRIEKEELRIVNIRPNSIRRLAALIAPSAGKVNNIALRLCLSHAQRHQLSSLSSSNPLIKPDLDTKNEQKLFYKTSPNILIDLIIMEWAREEQIPTRVNANRRKNWISFIKRQQKWETPPFPIDGNDVIKSGIKKGPKVGSLLARIENWWLDNGLAPDRSACLNQLKAITQLRQKK